MRHLTSAAALCAVAAQVLPAGQYTFTDPKSDMALRHCDYQYYATPIEGGNDDFSFLVTPALSGNVNEFSLQSINYPSMYATVTGANNGASEATRMGIATNPVPADSSFITVPGLADPTKVSLQMAGGKYKGLYVTRIPGQRSGSCAGNYNGDAGDVILDDKDQAAATWGTVFSPPPPPPNILVDLSAPPLKPINKRFFGCHLDPGYTQQPRFWYSQLVYGENFESGTMRVPSWVSVSPNGVSFTAAPDASTPFNGKPSMKFTYASGNGAAGLANRGMGAEGMFLQGGRDYEGYVFAQGPAGASFTVSLQDFTSGATLASQAFTFPASGGWTQFNVSMTPTAGTSCAYITPGSDPTIDCQNVPNADHACVRCGGQLLLSLSQPTAINVGYVFLQPGTWGRVGDLPVNARAGELVKTMGVGVIRQGGTVSQGFRWKDWRGAPWTRAAMGHTWGDSLVTWGPFEMMDLADYLGFEMVLTLAYDLNTADDWADLVEYVWGNETTTWGAQRIADRGGVLAPYNISTFELGNEQANPDFVQQVIAMETRAQSIGRPGELHFMYPTNQGVDAVTASALVTAGINPANVAPDIHIGAGGAISVAQSDWAANPSFQQSAINAETNAGTHDMGRALGEAADLNEWLTVPPEVDSRLWARTASFCSERSGHFDGFDQGIAFFLPNMTWLQPPGWVHAMIAQTPADVALNFTYASQAERDAPHRLRAAAGQTVSVAKSTSTGWVYARVTNSVGIPTTVSVTLSGATVGPTVTIWTLAAPQTSSSNSPQAPTAVSPVQTTAAYPASGPFNATLPPYSFVIYGFTT